MTSFHGYPIRAVGITWFREEDYSALRALFTDGHKMPRTWKEWLKGAEKAEKRLQNEGHMTERVYIDPDTFLGWCAENETTVDTKGRNKFAAAFVAEKYRTRG